MKKLFAVLIIPVLIISCNNSDTTTISTTTDSVTATESPLMDAVNTRDSASKIILDSSGKLKDSMMKQQ